MLFSGCLCTCAGEREGKGGLLGVTGQRLAPHKLGGREEGVRLAMQVEGWQPMLPPGVLLETYSSGSAGGGALV